MTRFLPAVLAFAGIATSSGAPASGATQGTLSRDAQPSARSASPAIAPVEDTKRALPAEPPVSSEPPLRVPLPRSLMIAPHGCAGVKQNFDLLIHFHGAYTTTEPQLMKSGIDAVYVIQNLGTLSGPYENAFAGPRALEQQVEAIRASVNQRCGGEHSVARIALSGWSAGYGAIYHVLSFPESAARVDAVLLADGMHVGYEPGSHRVRSAAMEPFTRFAAMAARGEKLMAVTHSSIVPPNYASTTETANFLVSSLELSRQATVNAEPRPGMQPSSHAERGNLFITGYAGGDAHAHCDHLYAIGDTLWSRLRDRWAKH